MNFVIIGETPAKKNSRIVLRNGRNIPSKRYSIWHTAAQAELMSQKERGFVPIETPVIINLKFFHADKRRRDSDNGVSSILDTLVDSGILKDDNWQIVRILNVYNFFDRKNARCEIDIKTIDVDGEKWMDSF